MEFRWSHDFGIHLATDDVMTNSLVTNNGRYGFNCGGADRGPTVTDSVIEYSNNLYFHSIREGGSWAEGAFKCVFTGSQGPGNGFKFLRNTSRNNYGHGGWVDIGNLNVEIKDNHFENNLLYGFFDELGCSAEISGNTAIDNGAYNTWGGPKVQAGDQFNYPWEGAGLAVMTARDTNVHDNTVEGNVTGIQLIEDMRRGTWQGCSPILANNLVQHNSVRQMNGKLAAGFHYVPEAQTNQPPNRYVDNDYILPALSTAAFLWQPGNDTFTQWQAAGQDTTGSVQVG
jgi:hypothetical protein